MSSPETKSWQFLTSHTQVLLCIHRDPEVRLRDIAATVGVTERAAQRIVGDLVESGHITRERVGRRNRYVVNEHEHMRHPSQEEHEIRELLEIMRMGEPPRSPA